MLPLPTMMRSAKSSLVTTGTSLIIVEATRIQNRRSIPLGSHGEVPTPQEGKSGPLEHSRLGLVGWIAYWSLGNSALALKIIVGLIRKLDMTDSVFEALTPIAMTREADTNAK
jgi:hypothetical protein